MTDTATRPAGQLLGNRSFILGVDLGQRADYTGIVLLQRHPMAAGAPYQRPTLSAWFADAPGEEYSPKTEWVQDAVWHYRALHIERLPLGTAYTAVPGILRDYVDRTRHKVWKDHNTAAQRGWMNIRRQDVPISLVVDATGVGTAVVDLLRAADLSPFAVTITGGTTIGKPQPDWWSVPKRELAASVLVALESGRLVIPRNLPHAAILKAELEGFRIKVNPTTGHESFGAPDWRTGEHDDLVLALALAVWAGDAGDDGLAHGAV